MSLANRQALIWTCVDGVIQHGEGVRTMLYSGLPNLSLDLLFVETLLSFAFPSMGIWRQDRALTGQGVGPTLGALLATAIYFLLKALKYWYVPGLLMTGSTERVGASTLAKIRRMARTRPIR